jgi:hypothetical protein
VTQQGTFQLEAEPPPLRCGRLEQRICPCRAQDFPAGGCDECSRPAVQDGLCGGDDDDDVRLDERGVDAEWQRAGVELDQVLALHVVHLDVPMEAACEVRRDEVLELAVSRSASQPAGDEERLEAGRDSQALQLLHRRGDCRLARIPLGARKRQLRRFHHDRRPRTARGDRLQWFAGEGEAKRVAHGGANVCHSVGRGRRPEDSGVIVCGHDDEPRPRKHRDPCHGAV